MSLAIVNPSPLALGGSNDYEPASPGAREIALLWKYERNYLRGAAIDWTPTIEAAWREIRSGCMRAGWDGPGSIAITDNVIAVAQKVLDALYRILPKGTLAPDIIAESDGEISISWSVGTSKVFALSVGRRGRLNFAGQFGEEGGIHGWEPLDTSSRGTLEASLPRIAAQIERLDGPTRDKRAA